MEPCSCIDRFDPSCRWHGPTLLPTLYECIYCDFTTEDEQEYNRHMLDHQEQRGMDEHDPEEPIDVGFQGPFFEIIDLGTARSHAWVDSRLFWGQCAICPLPRSEHP